MGKSKESKIEKPEIKKEEKKKEWMGYTLKSYEEAEENDSWRTVESEEKEKLIALRELIEHIKPEKPEEKEIYQHISDVLNHCVYQIDRLWDKVTPIKKAKEQDKFYERIRPWED